MRRAALQRNLCTFLLLPALWLAVSGFKSEQPAKPAAKPAWKWTLEERLAARFDPAVGAERQDGFTRRVTENRDGRRTPELFSPGELFDILLYGAFAPRLERAGIQGSRADYEQWAAALGLGSGFWERLEEAAAPYLMLLQEGGRPRLPSKADIAAPGEERLFHICRARLQALEAAEAEFGEEAFLRLLYEGVAPSVQDASVYSSYQRKVEDLRFQEGGCR